MELLLLLPSFLVVQALASVLGYPSGAPTGACEDMMPRHTGVTPQISPAPYTLLTNARTFQPGKAITGTGSALPPWEGGSSWPVRKIE